MFFALTEGRELGLNVSRFDERQRRLRLRLAKTADCWDYAPLIDVVLREAGFATHRFTGRTAAQWLSDWKASEMPDTGRFMAWYEAVVSRHLATLSRRPRVPDNHYCIELARIPLESSLPGLIRNLGLKRASVEHWSATLNALPAKGVKAEELTQSGVLTRMQRLPTGASLTQAQVLHMIDLGHVTPTLACESRFGFVARAGWRECCQQVPQKEFKRRGLLGVGHGTAHIRYRHRSLGWSIVRTRYRDLIADRTDWWNVLDENGRLIAQPAQRFESAEDTIEFAELQISQRFDRWGKDHAVLKWERFSLPGGDGYQELLLQLDDWPGAYQPRHYRTRNVLVHIRTSMRQTQAGKRVLFLDEVQSDWHADLHAEAKPAARKKPDVPPPDAPFRKEWPLLSMKVMLWWAQRLGAQGLAWSSAELQASRWRGNGPPEMLYRTVLPDAARALAATFGLSSETTRMPVRATGRAVELGERGWEVRGRNGAPLTKPFRTRAQAECFADHTGDIAVLDVPVIWIEGLEPIAAVPLYGTGSASMWFGSKGKSSPVGKSMTEPRTQALKAARHAA